MTTTDAQRYPRQTYRNHEIVLNRHELPEGVQFEIGIFVGNENVAAMPCELTEADAFSVARAAIDGWEGPEPEPPPADDPSKPYKVVCEYPVFCWITDALIGSRKCVDASFATYDEAFAAVNEAAGDGYGDESYSVALMVNGELTQAPEDVEKARIRDAEYFAVLAAQDSGLPF